MILKNEREQIEIYRNQLGTVVKNFVLLEKNTFEQFVSDFIVKIPRISNIQNYIKEILDVVLIDKNITVKFIEKCEEERANLLNQYSFNKSEDNTVSLLNKKRHGAKLNFEGGISQPNSTKPNPSNSTNTSSNNKKVKCISDYFKVAIQDRSFKNVKEKISSKEYNHIKSTCLGNNNNDIDLKSDTNHIKTVSTPPLLSPFSPINIKDIPKNENFLSSLETLPSSTTSSKFIPLSFTSTNKFSNLSCGSNNLDLNSQMSNASFDSFKNSSSNFVKSPSLRGINSKLGTFSMLPHFRSTSTKKKIKKHQSISQKVLQNCEKKLGEQITKELKLSLQPKPKEKNDENTINMTIKKFVNKHFYNNNTDDDTESEKEEKIKSETKSEEEDIKEKVNEKEGKDDNVLAYKTPEKVKPLNRFSNIIINDITSRKNLYLLFSQNVHG